MRHRPWGLVHHKTPSRLESMCRAQTALVLPSFLACGLNFLKCDFAGSLSKFEDTRQRSIDFFLPSIHLGHDPGNGAAMAGNDERFPPLHVIEQLGQMGFGFGSLDFTHLSFLTSQFDWFNLTRSPLARLKE